jgi:voltage-gated potassium channel
VQPLELADLLGIMSLLLAPLLHGGLGFLRVLRTLRLLHSVRLITSLRSDLPFFRRNEEAALAAAQLGVFIFVMTGLVFETQHRGNPHITNYSDALYFTVTALTTTGFGDIVLQGPLGRLLSVVIMLAGVTLFLRLAQTLFRPNKVRFSCPDCGLERHEPDAVHCKACGILLNIPDEGAG